MHVFPLFLEHIVPHPPFTIATVVAGPLDEHSAHQDIWFDGFADLSAASKANPCQKLDWFHRGARFQDFASFNQQLLAILGFCQ